MLSLKTRILAQIDRRSECNPEALCYCRQTSQRRLASKQQWVENMTNRVSWIANFLMIFVACCSGAAAQQQIIGAPPEASNMKLVGTNDLQARSAYPPPIHSQAGPRVA